ncbi:MAG: alpha-E domain-containing protein [Burkholderiaceae bacterium]|jgi:uncharacterized alpha-E superfamily protein|nr:alpha-E domain-containing protein [Burkholderiaceae bacterium]
MLSRTADHLFWMSRYTERAENTARMLDVNVEMALLPQSAQAADSAWRGLLTISELDALYQQSHAGVSAREVTAFMVADERNPSSIASCLRAARDNARAVRGALTTEVWETQNQTWLELQEMLKTKAYEADPGQFFEWVKFRSHLSRGVAIGTMLQDEAYNFVRMGTFLERADNTARLIDVKFHSDTDHASMTSHYARQAIRPGRAGKAGELPSTATDYYYWSAILRSVSGFEIYRKVYRDVIKPERVAELLLLRPDMPRSLHASLNGICVNLQAVATDATSETMRHAGKLRAELAYADIGELMAMGLHAYLTNFLDRINDLGSRISRDFLLPAA